MTNWKRLKGRLSDHWLTILAKERYIVIFLARLERRTIARARIAGTATQRFAATYSRLTFAHVAVSVGQICLEFDEAMTRHHHDFVAHVARAASLHGHGAAAACNVWTRITHVVIILAVGRHVVVGVHRCRNCGVHHDVVRCRNGR